MANQELVQYIKVQLDLGLGKAKIKSLLLTEGWTENDIDAAIEKATNPEPPEPTPHAAPVHHSEHVEKAEPVHHSEHVSQKEATLHTIHSTPHETHHDKEEHKPKMTEKHPPLSDNNHVHKNYSTALIYIGILELILIAAICLWLIPTVMNEMVKSLSLQNPYLAFYSAFGIVSGLIVIQIIYGIAQLKRVARRKGLFLFGNLSLLSIALLASFLVTLFMINQAYKANLKHIQETTAPKLSNSQMLVKVGMDKFQKVKDLKKKKGASTDEKDAIQKLTNETLVELTIAVRDDPGNFDAWYSLGYVYANSKGVVDQWYENGTNAIHHALAIQPKDGDAYMVLTQLENANKNYPTNGDNQ